MQNIKKISQTMQSIHTTNLNNVHSLHSLCIIFWNLYCVRLHRTLFQCSLKLIQENFLWLIQESGSVPISTKAVLSATKVVFLVQQLIFYLLFQVYHMCTEGGHHFSYRCPNTTLFQQRMLICAHAYQVNCNRTELYYANNLLIGQKDKHFVNEDPVFFPVGEFDIKS